MSKTSYEWVFESLSEHGDIEDADFTNSLEETQVRRQLREVDGHRLQLALVRNVFRSVDDDLEDRQHAYAERLGPVLEMPLEFDGGTKVPKWALAALRRAQSKS